MLTPVDIKNKTFKTFFGGYNKKEVDTYLYNIVESYEEVYKQNKDLDEKNNILASNLASYKTIEKQLEKSLVLAQKAAEDVQNEARKEAQVIEERAKLEAKKILEDAKLELSMLEKKIDELAIKYEGYKSQVKNVAITQIELIDNAVFKFEKKTSYDATNKINDEIDVSYSQAAAAFDEI